MDTVSGIGGCGVCNVCTMHGIMRAVHTCWAKAACGRAVLASPQLGKVHLVRSLTPAGLMRITEGEWLLHYCAQR